MRRRQPAPPPQEPPRFASVRLGTPALSDDMQRRQDETVRALERELSKPAKGAPA